MRPAGGGGGLVVVGGVVLRRQEQQVVAAVAGGQAGLKPAEAGGQRVDGRDGLQQIEEEGGERGRGDVARGEARASGEDHGDHGELVAEGEDGGDQRAQPGPFQGDGAQPFGVLGEGAGGQRLGPVGLDRGEGLQVRGEALGDVSDGVLLSGHVGPHTAQDQHHHEGQGGQGDKGDHGEDPVDPQHHAQGRRDGHGGQRQLAGHVHDLAQQQRVGGDPGGEFAGALGPDDGQGQAQRVFHQGDAQPVRHAFADAGEQEAGACLGEGAGRGGGAHQGDVTCEWVMAGEVGDDVLEEEGEGEGGGGGRECEEQCDGEGAGFGRQLTAQPQWARCVESVGSRLVGHGEPLVGEGDVVGYGTHPAEGGAAGAEAAEQSGPGQAGVAEARRPVGFAGGARWWMGCLGMGLWAVPPSGVAGAGGVGDRPGRWWRPGRLAAYAPHGAVPSRGRGACSRCWCRS